MAVSRLCCGFGEKRVEMIPTPDLKGPRHEMMVILFINHPLSNGESVFLGFLIRKLESLSQTTDDFGFPSNQMSHPIHLIDPTFINIESHMIGTTSGEVS